MKHYRNLYIGVVIFGLGFCLASCSKRIFQSEPNTVHHDTSQNQGKDAQTVNDQNQKTQSEEIEESLPPAKRVRASHILVQTEEECLKIKEAILNGERDFADAAAEFSQCPSSANGGDLGFFYPNQMVPEFDKCAFSSPVGKVVGPIKTQFGYHLLLVTCREEE